MAAAAKDFAGVGTNVTISTGATWTRTWSNTFLQEIRGGVSYYHNEAVTDAVGLKTSDEVGIKGVNINDFSDGLTTIQINQGFNNPVVGFSASLPWDRSERTVEVSTVLTKIAGNHTVKFGGNRAAQPRLSVAGPGSSRAAWRIRVQCAADGDSHR